MADGPTFQFSDRKMPQAYEDLLVPRLFEPWAKHLLDLAQPKLGEALLDVATGTGIVARLAAQRVGSHGKVVAADLSPQMLMIGRNRTSFGGQARIDWMESPAAPLRVSDASFDVVTCQQGLQFFPDKLAALKEMKRALKPGGRAALAVWRPIDACPPFHAVQSALREAGLTDLAERIVAPFSFGDARALEELLRAAGFRDVDVRGDAMELAFEGGLEQAIGIVSAIPLAPDFAALPEDKRTAYAVAARKAFGKLAQGKTVRGLMASNLALAKT